jgi:hypothetical protein
MCPCRNSADRAGIYMTVHGMMQHEQSSPHSKQPVLIGFATEEAAEEMDPLVDAGMAIPGMLCVGSSVDIVGGVRFVELRQGVTSERRCGVVSVSISLECS